MARPRKILIIGCGYVGEALARQLQADGNSVTAWVHSEESATALRAKGYPVIMGDVSREQDWSSVPTDFTAAVHCASSNRGGAGAYELVYREGLRNVIRHLPEATKVFTSSTSVYAQTTGEIVTEASPAEPVTETGQLLRETEDLGREYGVIILRLAGIYGPGRSVLMARLKRGEAVIEGDGMRWLNQIHRDDAATAIRHALDSATAGEIYNVSDNEPVSYWDFYRWACTQWHLPVPPFGPIPTHRKRELTHKRVSNAKLRATGWSPKFPTFREGYVDCAHTIA